MGALSQTAVRLGARVRRFSARTGVAVQRCAASDAAPWPGAAVVELDGTPVRRAAPWPEVPQGEPWRAVAQDGPWPGVPQVGPLVQLARPLLDAGHTRRCLPPSSRSWRHSKLQRKRQAET
jgi:hypothetical protein